MVSASPRTVVLALRAGAAHHWLDDAQWTSALSHRDASVRREACELLAGAGELSPPIERALTEVLGDDDSLVVESAAFALGERGVVAALDSLITVAADHADARCRESAIAALGSLGDDRAKSTVIGALSDKPPVRRRAVVALSNFEGPDVEAALEAAREDRDWQVRSAVDQLGRAPLDD